MSGRKLLFLWCAVFALSACEDVATDPGRCQGKCDSLGDTDITQLMPRAPITPGTVSITRNHDQWLFEVIGARGEIVLLSQNYAQRSSALNGVLSVEENGVLAERYQLISTDGGWSFVLRAGNNEVIADGQVFATEAEAQEAARTARNLVAGIVQYKAALTEGARFELVQEDSRWEFDLRDEDDQPLLRSQTYSRRRDAITGIESVRKNGKEEARYELLDSPPRFILKAANGQEIAESATTYESFDAARAAITSTQALLVSERVANPW